MQSNEALETVWKSQPAVIRAFIEARPNYAKLAEEVAYILENLVRAAGVEYAHVTHRAKSLESFCEKVFRKGYDNPLQNLTDFAGVRIVFLYISDRREIEKLVAKHFRVIEKVDKVDESEFDRFGYGALHYLVRLGKKYSGARYDELKDLVCELQVRTVMQDAWAVVDHHLNYKQESDVPRKLRRGLSALSAVFEDADDKFDRLRDERRAYAEEVKQQISDEEPKFLRQEINLENLIEYLRWRFPDREQDSRADAASFVSELGKYGYKRIQQVNEAVNRADAAIQAAEAQSPPCDDLGMDCKYTAIGAIRGALYFTDKSYLDDRKAATGGTWPEIERCKHLVKERLSC
jgi:ppGpp synthetase/RelA/SpoT-type nucleotidyltranferase